MEVKGIDMFQAIAHRLGGWPERKALILLYHRISELETDPWGLSVTSNHFAEHLEILGKHAQILPLRHLDKAFRGGVLPRRSAVLTFDDGYIDNLTQAKPVLERYEAPATVFITTGMLQCENEFWWDELDRLLLQPNKLPEKLHLKVDGTMHQWEAGETAHYSQAEFLRQRHWKAWEEAPTPRHALYRSLWEILHPLPARLQRAALDDLNTWAEAEPSQRETHRTLSPSEVLALAEGGLIEIGAHTVTHPALSAIPVSSQENEIRQSKAQLEEILGERVESFSYPYGHQVGYSEDTIRIVREAGYTRACSSYGGRVQRSTDRFQLPRVQVNDWDRETFEQWIWGQFNS